MCKWAVSSVKVGRLFYFVTINHYRSMFTAIIAIGALVAGYLIGYQTKKPVITEPALTAFFNQRVGEELKKSAMAGGGLPAIIGAYSTIEKAFELLFGKRPDRQKSLGTIFANFIQQTEQPAEQAHATAV